MMSPFVVLTKTEHNSEYSFYNNGANSRALIGRGLWSMSNDVTCHAVPARFSRKLLRKLKIKCYGKKTNPSQFSMVYTLIDHRNDAIKCSKLCSETTRLQLVVPLEFSTFYDIISMVYNSVDDGKL